MVMEIIISVMLLLVGIAVLVVIHVCIVGRAFRGEGEEIVVIQRRGNYGKRMSSEDLQKLPCYDYKVEERGNRETSAVDCAVCLENFRMGERCRLLPNCRHSFHAECIDSWLLKTPICPICRTCADISKIGLVLEEGTGVMSDAPQIELIQSRLGN